jgi:F-type H+-transporting ATPase subunit a
LLFLTNCGNSKEFGLLVNFASESGLEKDPGFSPPGVKDFNLPPFIEGNSFATKPILLVFLSVILISIFFFLSARRAAVVPSKLQFAGEGIYGFIRNDVAHQVIGHEFMRFVPYLFTLFTFIAVNNFFGIVPLLQFPTMSKVSFPYVLAFITFLVFHYVGIRKHGVISYLKGIMFIPGVPKAAYILVTPLELATYFIVRPLTLSLRLFANMFAGHLLLLVFILGGEHLLSGVIGLKLVSPFAFIIGIAMTFFEFMVQILQAYIFTLLTALYIAGGLADEH